MAQETKVGLVVGLGFIVCFAMILANRGGADRIRPQMPYQLFSGPTAPSGTSSSLLPEQHAQSLRNDPRRSDARPHAAAKPSAVEPTGTGRPDPGTAGDPDRFSRRRPIPRPQDVAEPESAVADRTTDSGVTLLAGGPAPETESPERAPATHHAEPVVERADKGAPLPAALAPYAEQFEKKPPRDEAAATVAAAAPTPGEAEHVVASGDTLTKIARRYYGSTGKDTVDALYAANRTVLNSPNAAPVGRTLRLPVIGGKAPRGKSAEAGTKPGRDAGPEDAQPDRDAVAKTGKAGREPAPALAKNDRPAYRKYTVQKGDLLSTIAQKQLGSAQRWKEIVALNKNLCSNAHNLPCGAEIRIPAETLADAR